MSSSRPAPLPTVPGFEPEPAWRERLRRIGLWSALGAGVLAIALGIYVVVLLRITPSVDDLKQVQAQQPSVLLSADGQQIASFRRAQQERLTLDKVSPFVVKALVATEDKRFYEHRGIDFVRSVGAVLHSAAGDMQGGSTITQQLARNLFPDEVGRARNLHRKAKEWVTAMRIERVYDKTQILEAYLNTAPFLYNAVGIEMAARTYFDTSAAELDVLQSATLVGMLKGTYYYNPVQHPERALARRNVVLSQMAKAQAITDEQLRTLSAQPLELHWSRQPDFPATAPHFAAYARKWLLDWADEHDEDLYADGLVIETTLDSRLQAEAERAVQVQADALQQVADTEWSRPALPAVATAPEAYAKLLGKSEPFGFLWAGRRDLVTAFVRESPEFKKAVDGGASPEAALEKLRGDAPFMARLKAQKTRLEAGFVAMDPRNGEIRAWVGSRDFAQEQYDHVAQAERQPGSTFKPFVYGAALEAGLTPDRTFVDGPVEVTMGGSVWRPTDMSGSTGEPMTIRDGLALSKNTITAQVMQEVGIPRVVALAKSLGVDQSPLEPVPSLALGTSPVTLLEMVNAYASIAQVGSVHKPVFVKRIKDRTGRVIAEFGEAPRRGMSPEAATDLIDMMRGVIARGTGTQVRSRFGVTGDLAGKTGTTQKNTDGWFILMHPELVAGAWVGFNDARVTLRSSWWGQGGHNAVRLVGDFFRDAQKKGLVDPKASFPPPRVPVPPVEPAASAPEGANDGEGGSLEPANGDDQPPKTSEELGQILNGMGLDPKTGVPKAPGDRPAPRPQPSVPSTPPSNEEPAPPPAAPAASDSSP
ncbi:MULTISPECIES: penicillin-binding protein 1A [unclassified Rhizobacter]|uniref:penicillin-binding protein 1A n=1 Tax=unclassified Rhizobacter TaxID=2640088 RepID=UPI0009E779EF|nr:MULTISPECIES: transglycosylase domain-containing protein [unclassified Rhizobacter]